MHRMVSSFLILLLSLSLVGAHAQKTGEQTFIPWAGDEECNNSYPSYLCIPVDQTWEVVEFDGYSAPCFQNDDGSSMEDKKKDGYF